MELKERILSVLETLKKAGFSREDIEKKLALSPKGLTQSLSRGGSKRLYTALELLSKDLLSNSTPATQKTTKEVQPGFIDTNRYLEMVETQNEFLRRNFETSLNSIKEGLLANGAQMKVLTWYSAVVANNGDQVKANQDLLKIYNNVAASEGINVEDGNLKKAGKGSTSGKQK